MEKRRYEAPRTEIVVVVGERMLVFASDTTDDNFSKRHDFLYPYDEEYIEYGETGNSPKESLWED